MAFLGHHAQLGPLHERRQALVSIAEEYAAQVKVWP